MAPGPPGKLAYKPEPVVLDWLLDADPAIRWQVKRDLMKAPDEDVNAERSRVALEGWGAWLLGRQRAGGEWGDGPPGSNWSANLYSLRLLRELGADPAAEPVQRAITRVRDQVTWGPEFGNSPFFEGEVEPCINGGTLVLGAYFGQASDRLPERLLGEQLEDGGWNCEAERGSTRSSFNTTMCVIEGLLEYEISQGPVLAVSQARERAHDYLLERHLFRRLSTGEVIEPAWTEFSFPTTWHYDVLRALDYLRRANVEPDQRMAEAIDLVVAARGQDGRWLRGRVHRNPADLEMEGGSGGPSRWITLRALRVLGCYSGGD